MGIIRRSGHSGKAARPKTVVADACHIRGELTLDGDLHIDGHIEGSIQAVNISIGKNGYVKGNVHAVHVTVSGTLEGKVKCDLLELLDGCKLQGEVQCLDLVVEKGAKFFGSTREIMAATLVNEEPMQKTNVSQLPLTNEPAKLASQGS